MMRVRTSLIAALFVWMLGSVGHAIDIPITRGSRAAYGAITSADATVLPQKVTTLNIQLCRIEAPTDCADRPLTWNRAKDESPRDGRVDFVRGISNGQGWLVADYFLKLGNIDDNRPGWALAIYTDNTAEDAHFRYTGANVDGLGIVGGLVSNDGLTTLPLAWKLELTPVRAFPDSPSFMADEVSAGQLCPSGQSRDQDGFCDFAFHYIVDKNDKKPDSEPPGEPSWWENLQCDSADVDCAKKRRDLRNYQSILTSGGYATGDFYRLPFATVSKDVTGNVYIAAKFAEAYAGLRYATTINLDIIALSPQ